MSKEDKIVTIDMASKTSAEPVNSNVVMPESKYDFSMLYVKNKLTFGCLVRATFKEGEDGESSGGFFSKASTIGEEIKTLTTFMYVKPNGKEIDFINIDSKGSSFLTSGSGAPTFDMYSEDISKAIKKDIGKYKGFLGKQPENVIIDVNKLEMSEIKVLTESNKFIDSRDNCIKQYNLMMKGIEAERKKHAGVGLDEFFERYEFKKHIMLMSPAGFGKTYQATKWISEKGYASEFIAGSTAIESIDLLGYWIKGGDGNLVWLDGALTAAFRKALTKKTILLFDEILRVPARELSILVGALTPDSDGNYRLRTNRLVDEIDGIGETETLVIPMDNLQVIATTNVGAQYDVEMIDPALLDRFRIHDVKMATSTMHGICTDVNDGKLPDKTIDAIIDLYEKVKILVGSNELSRELSLRHLTEVINFAETASDVASFFQDVSTIICSRNTDGSLNETEHRIYVSTIKKTIR